MTPQDEIKRWKEERWVQDRCEMCGSEDRWISDWIFTGEDEVPCAMACNSCGHETDENEDECKHLFIGPGQHGSYDRVEDYVNG